MSEYQVIARKYRPQKFGEIIGQASLVTTLINAIKFNRIAHAYLFCGTRGTGKTSIARIFAKALNCPYLDHNFEPCNQCSSCKEITSGCSLDFIEIDGASNRGIDDIRQINETVSFTPSNGKYKIYLIDEVHMLTKEAFNALLKTLEEPPKNVKFFFATTEPHKVPQTILSRLQRFSLNRIKPDEIISKLRLIGNNLKRDIDEDALILIAKLAEGSLRDAESLFDQLLSFEEGKVTIDCATNMLGFASKSIFFNLDESVKNTNLAFAFELTSQLFQDGKDLYHFVDSLIEHYRNILTSKLDPKAIANPLYDKALYFEASKIYSNAEVLNILEYLLQARSEMKNSLSPQIHLEIILLHLIQTKKRLLIETVVEKLAEFETKILTKDEEVQDQQKKKSELVVDESYKINSLNESSVTPKIVESAFSFNKDTIVQQNYHLDRSKDHKNETGSEKKIAANKEIEPLLLQEPATKPKVAIQEVIKQNIEPNINSKISAVSKKDETLMQFAAVELEGTLKIHTLR
jgi:DNA polymerase-3 subunit gamma/tau